MPPAGEGMAVSQREAAEPRPSPAEDRDVPLRLPGLLLRGLAVGVAYGLGSVAGRSFFFPGSTYSIVWPPNAVLVFALLVLPVRAWLPALGFAGVAHLLVQAGRPPIIIAFTLFHNIGLALLATWAGRRWLRRPPRLNDLDSAVRFVGLLVLLAPAVAALADLVLRETGLVPVVSPDIWWRNFFSNALAMVLILPPAFAIHEALRERRAVRGRLLESILLTAGLMTAGILATLDGTSSPAALLSLPMPFLLWAAVRFGPGGAALAVGGFFLVLTVGALRGAGPFVHNASASVFSLQAFTLNIGATFVLLAALVREREATARSTRQVEMLLRRSLETSGTAAWDVDLRTGATVVWNSLTRDTGGGPEAAVPVAEAIRNIHPADRARIDAAMAGGVPERVDIEVRVQGLEGRQHWLLMRGRRTDDEDGRPIAMTGTSVDITHLKRLEGDLRRSRARSRALARDVLEGREAERQLIGRLIHEGIAQDAAAIGLDIGVARSRTARADPALAAILDRLQTSVDALTTGLRDLSRDLRTASLEHLGLAAAITTLAETMQLRTGIPVTVHVASIPPLEALRASEIYQAVREVVGYAASRQRARSVSLDARAADESVIVDIRAFGGVRDSAPDSLREHVAVFGGQLKTGRTRAGTWRARLRMRVHRDGGADTDRAG